MIKLQVLLRKPWRNPGGIAKVQSLMQSLGITTTTSGSVSVSAEIDAAAIKSAFGVESSSAAQVPIPEPLREFVESITVAPRPMLYSEKHKKRIN